MSDSVFSIERSMLDEERFDVRSARARGVSAANCKGMVDFCRDQDVRFLIARCSADDLPAAQWMEANGFLLMDTLIYYRRSLVNLPEASTIEGIEVRPAGAADACAIEQVAEACFAGYKGHYHADPRLPGDAANQAYISWAARSCVSKDVADEVLAATFEGEIAGFATLRLVSQREGEGVLFGVAPRAQGKGLYRRFMVEGMHWCRSRGAKRMIVSTQITNIAVQTAWVGLGFAPYQSFYTFHKWFD